MTSATFWIWIIAGVALGALELFTGTFYLLVLAGACFAAGLADFAGLAAAPCGLVFAAVAVAGSLAVRLAGRARRGGEAEALQNPDVGRPVEVASWRADGTAEVTYRGAVWTAELARGCPRRAGAHVIDAVEGSRLVVRPAG
ncbi:MAG: NfeD family protein [Duodenibacillus sp.]|nr:NfeD family protein [Duodenibacillus sp.]